AKLMFVSQNDPAGGKRHPLTFGVQSKHLLNMSKLQVHPEQFTYAPYQPSAYRQREFLSFPGIQGPTLAIGLPGLRQPPSELLAPDLRFRAGNLGSSAQVFAPLRVQLLGETRENAVANAVACVPEVAIGRVFPPALADFLQIAKQVGAASP